MYLFAIDIYLISNYLLPGVAVQLARQMECLDISWFEEPVCPCTVLYCTVLYCIV